MKYLSLYKTQSEHDSDNSRLIPNISLITDEQRLILTNENNIGTTFEEVDILESFDDIINRFPTGNSTGMPGIKIYADNSDQSKAKNIKLFNDALQWRKDYILHNGLNDTSEKFIINVDALVIDGLAEDSYDDNYKYYIDIYKDHIILIDTNNHQEILTISGDGSVIIFNEFPTNDSTKIPGIRIYTDNSVQSKEKNIKLYNNAQEWRSNYISYNGLSDTGQPISMFIDKLNIDAAYMDEYDNSYHYHIDIYNNRIILLNDSDSSEVLIISSDGSVTILDIFNRFPSPTEYRMPGLKIYSDNTDQSKAKNIKLYNDAQKWRDNFISYHGSSDTGQEINMKIDALVIYDTIWDEYDGNYKYYIDIYNDRIILLYGYYSEVLLTISSDGSVIFNEFPTNGNTHMPVINIYTDNTSQSKENNVELYNDAQKWRSNYISYHGSSDTGYGINMYVDALIIDEVNIDKYDQNYYYYIDIYKDHIILIDTNNHQEILTISGDGSVSNTNLATTPLPQLPDIDTTSTFMPVI